MTPKKQRQYAERLKALGDPTRLEIVTMLSKCCAPLTLDAGGGVRRAAGPTAGEVCCRITGEKQINSRISFHLKELRQAGLISVERQGKYMVCAVERNALSELSDLFQKMCARLNIHQGKSSCRAKKKSCRQ